MNDWQSIERLLSSAGAMGVLCLLVWRLPMVLKMMLDFGLEVQRENAATVRACCGHRLENNVSRNFEIPKTEVPGTAADSAPVRRRA